MYLTISLVKVLKTFIPHQLPKKNIIQEIQSNGYKNKNFRIKPET
jgi:hypothetical protein